MCRSVPRSRFARLAAAMCFAISAFGIAVSTVPAQHISLPPVLDAAAMMSDRLGSKASLDVQLLDDEGQLFVPQTRLSGERPIILNFGYFGCPGMCGFVLSTFVERLIESGLVPGRDLDLVTISVHPTETPILAKDKKQSYLTEFARPQWAADWPFLTGAPSETRRLAESVGWGFRHDPENDEIDHPPVVVLLSPNGVITRYLDARDFDATTLRRAIIETSGGKVGSFLERIVVTCLTYDPNSGRYEVAAMTIMRIGGVATVIAIAVMILLLWRRERNARAHSVPDAISA